jgi:hypothetical protein
MAAREVAVKRYVVRLSAEERERLEALRTGKDPGEAADEGADFVEGGRLGRG